MMYFDDVDAVVLYRLYSDVFSANGGEDGIALALTTTDRYFAGRGYLTRGRSAESMLAFEAAIVRTLRPRIRGRLATDRLLALARVYSAHVYYDVPFAVGCMCDD